MTGEHRHVVLVGLMGAGKSAVGRRCAQRLDRELIDTDELVEAAAGVPVTEIFAAEGESGFRSREVEAVADAVAAPRPAVIACGGGAVLDARSRQRLAEGGFVVWLTAPVGVLAARVADDESRPLLAGGDPAAELARLADLREPAYRSVADVVIDTGGRSPDEVAEVVIEALERSEAPA